MLFDSDVALLGTGVAPLVAANHLLIQGRSVLLLNPDLDYYLEGSELPLDPMVQKNSRLQRLLRSTPENALSVLRPEFPGAIEFWSLNQDNKGFHDSTAPHIRQRGRLWIHSPDDPSLWTWEELEDLYVEASDSDLNPQLLDGISATHRFPGLSSRSGNFRGLYLPKLCDVDTARYKNGLLEYIRERIEPEKVICSVNSVERMPDGIRFHANGTLNTAKLREGMLVFWTPRLSSWILKQAKKSEISPRLPLGARIWEHWSINSRDPIDPSTVGMFKNMTVWCDFEGQPRERDYKLAVLRAGPLVSLERLSFPQGGLSWASSESFGDLSKLCHEFLKWDRFSIRSMRASAIFEWDQEQAWNLSDSHPAIHVIPACDGPLIDTVTTTRNACTQLLNAWEGHE